jgi:hypothetical protein
MADTHCAGIDHPTALKYFFTLKPQVETSPVGTVPGGYRVDLKYSGGDSSVTTDAEPYDKDWLPEALAKQKGVKKRTYTGVKPEREAPPPDDKPYSLEMNALYKLRQEKGPHRQDWFGIDGQITSGGDWLTVREDGVATFDGRVTIKADGAFLVDAVISGVVDLRDPKDPMPEQNAKRSKVFEDWLLGTLKKTDIDVVLPLRFEAAQAPSSWASKTIKQGSEGYWKFERLVRGQFVAVGTVKLQSARYSPIASVTLDVYEIRKKA